MASPRPRAHVACSNGSPEMQEERGSDADADAAPARLTPWPGGAALSTEVLASSLVCVGSQWCVCLQLGPSAPRQPFSSRCSLIQGSPLPILQPTLHQEPFRPRPSLANGPSAV